MALTGTFDADFTAFLGEIDKAKDQLSTLRATTDALSESVSQVVDNEAPAEMNQLAESTERGSAAAASATVSWQEWAKGLVTAEVIIRGVDAAWALLTGTISDGISQAIEAEDAQAALLGALQQQGTAVPSVVTAFDDYAAALQRTTIYSADAVTAAEKILVQIGDVMPRDMQKALRATAQLATALEIDLPRAATMVAKAAQGQTSALKQTKIEFGETTGTAVDFTNILKKLEDQYGNNAEQMAKTAGGQMKQAENAWNDLKQSIGKTITSNETVRTVLGDLNRLFTTNTGELTNNATANTLVSEAVILLVKGFGLAVEAIDYFQQQLHETMKVTDLAGIGFLKFYESLQKIEIATQQGMAALGSAAAIERVREANEALEWAEGAIKGYRDHMAEADKTSQEWSAGLATLRTNLGIYAQQLEATKGKLHEVNAAQAEAPGVWTRATGAMTAQTMALQEHQIALDASAKGYVKFGTDVTAIAKARETTVVTAAAAEVKAREDATASFWKMHDAEEAALSRVGKTAAEAAYNEQKAVLDSIAAQTAARGDADQAFWDMHAAREAALEQERAAAEATAEGILQVNDAVTVSANTMIGAVMQLQALMPGEISPAYAPGAVTSNVNPLLGYELTQRYGGPRQAFGGGGLGSAFGAMGGQIVVNNTLNYPIVNDPQAMNQFGNLVGQSIMQNLSGSGVRF